MKVSAKSGDGVNQAF